MRDSDANATNLVHCPPFADEQLYWQFGRHPGWSRIDRDGGIAFQYYGPLDDFGKKHLLAHFGLTQKAAELSVKKLQLTSPNELQALANRQLIAAVA